MMGVATTVPAVTVMFQHGATRVSDRVPSGSVDTAIIGGGSAGLSAALVLVRARRSVVVIDAGDPAHFAAPLPVLPRLGSTRTENCCASSSSSGAIRRSVPAVERRRDACRLARHGRGECQRRGCRVGSGDHVGGGPGWVDVIFSHPMLTAVDDLPEQLGLQRQATPYLPTPVLVATNGSGGFTSVPGVFVAGDLVDFPPSVPVAFASGTRAAGQA